MSTDRDPGSGLPPDGIVVATELRGSDGTTVSCPSAPILANSLRRRSLPVHLGPVVVDRLPHGPGDAPTAWVGVASPDRLPAVGAALREWRAVCEPHRILLAAPRSFCAGVTRAIDVVRRAIAVHGTPVYVRKQIVHNTAVVAGLADQGAVFVEDLDEVPPGATVVFSAHGVSPAVRAEAARRSLRVVDATCPLVAKVHREVRRTADGGGTTLLIGHAGHEEVEGTLGEAPESTVLVQDRHEAENLTPPRGAVSYVVQTTLAHEDVTGIVEVLGGRIPELTGPPTDDICYATTNRQRALRDVAAGSDLVLVVGSANSSNGNRLVEVAARCGADAHLVDGPADVDPRWLRGVRVVGVSAAASTPPELVDGVVDSLRGLGPATVEEIIAVTEDVHFALPAEVR